MPRSEMRFLSMKSATGTQSLEIMLLQHRAPFSLQVEITTWLMAQAEINRKPL